MKNYHNEYLEQALLRYVHENLHAAVRDSHEQLSKKDHVDSTLSPTSKWSTGSYTTESRKLTKVLHPQISSNKRLYIETHVHQSI